MEIGKLRWQVNLGEMRTVNVPDSPDTKDVFQSIGQVYANIEPVSDYTYLLGQQVERGKFTHKIIIRWRDDLDTFSYVERARTRPDGSTYYERFKTDRWIELEGRQRFVCFDAELLARGG